MTSSTSAVTSKPKDNGPSRTETEGLITFQHIHTSYCSCRKNIDEFFPQQSSLSDGIHHRKQGREGTYGVVVNIERHYKCFAINHLFSSDVALSNTNGYVYTNLCKFCDVTNHAGEKRKIVKV